MLQEAVAYRPGARHAIGERIPIEVPTYPLLSDNPSLNQFARSLLRTQELCFKALPVQKEQTANMASGFKRRALGSSLYLKDIEFGGSRATVHDHM